MPPASSAPPAQAPSTPTGALESEQALPWYRWELAPGIELQVRADVARPPQEVIERVLQAVREALAHGTQSLGTVDDDPQPEE